MTDGKLFIGLHQFRFPSPVITYVQAGVAQHAPLIERQGVELAWKRIGDDVFNEFGFLDPSGQAVRVQEAPTHFSSNAEHGETSLCGDFAEYSMPSSDFEAMRAFWEPLGFVALGETDTPFVRMSMTSDHVDLAVHRSRTLDQPMLLFTAPDMGERIERLRAAGLDFADDLPRGLDPRHSGLLRSPEGMAPLLISGVD
jgi:hypothetical protein